MATKQNTQPTPVKELNRLDRLDIIDIKEADMKNGRSRIVSELELCMHELTDLTGKKAYEKKMGATKKKSDVATPNSYQSYLQKKADRQ